MSIFEVHFQSISRQSFALTQELDQQVENGSGRPFCRRYDFHRLDRLCYQLSRLRRKLGKLAKTFQLIDDFPQIVCGPPSPRAEEKVALDVLRVDRAVCWNQVPAFRFQPWEVCMNRPGFQNTTAVIAFCLFATVQLVATTVAQDYRPGTNSRQAKEQALRSIPMDQLNQETQQKLSPILNRPSIYRRLPQTSIKIDPDYYLHLVRHPEVIINIWQLMGVTQMTADRTGPYTLATDDGVGTLGNVELVYGTNNMHVYYCEGDYKGSVLTRNLRGKCVIVLTTDYQLNEQGETVANSQLDIFLKIDNATLGLIAKTLHPIIGKTADHNFVESINFLERLNETTVKNGPGVQGMAHRLKTLTQEVRQEFVQVAGLVYDRSQARISNANYASTHSQTFNGNHQGQSSLIREIPTHRGNVQNPYMMSRQPQHQRHLQPTPVRRHSAPVRQSFGDQPPANSAQQPLYSTSQRPYTSNPYYNNR